MTETTQPKVVWTIESTHPGLVEPLKQALREVVDTEIGLNIVELGLVRDVEIQDEETAKITMILTTPFCPYGPALLEMSRQKAETALEKSTRIEMGMEMWDFSMMEEGAGADWGMW
jgi:metal-sulfur cluster biosynthetic enzyme